MSVNVNLLPEFMSLFAVASLIEPLLEKAAF